jgi:hypothetical protein
MSQRQDSSEDFAARLYISLARNTADTGASATEFARS